MELTLFARSYLYVIVLFRRTFGSSFEDIRGFILDGWQEMDNKKGETAMCVGGEHMYIGLEDCFQKVQNKNNVHIVINFDKHPGLINAVKRFQPVAKGKIISLKESDGQVNDENNIYFKLFKSEGRV